MSFHHNNTEKQRLHLPKQLLRQPLEIIIALQNLCVMQNKRTDIDIVQRPNLTKF